MRRIQLLKVDPPGPVIDAFIDVQRARADLERLRNEAEAYRNDILPRARGEAEKQIQGANAYREEIVNKAQGEAERFLKVLESYRQAKLVTTQRIYLETLEEVFRGMDKIIIDSAAKGGGVVPYLPLPEIRKRTPATNRARGGGANEPQPPDGPRHHRHRAGDRGLQFRFHGPSDPTGPGPPVRRAETGHQGARTPLQVAVRPENVVEHERRVLEFDPPAEQVILSDQKRIVADAYVRYKIADPLKFFQPCRPRRSPGRGCPRW